MNLKRIQNLISSSRNEVAYYDQTKYFLYKDIWPEVVIRPKRVGYEQFDPRPKSIATDLSCMLDFQNMIDAAGIVDNSIYVTKEEFVNLIS